MPNSPLSRPIRTECEIDTGLNVRRVKDKRDTKCVADRRKVFQPQAADELVLVGMS